MRPTPLLLAAASAAVLFAGCGAGSTDAGPVSPAAATGAATGAAAQPVAEQDEVELADGLLPAAEFDSPVTDVSAQELAGFLSGVGGVPGLHGPGEVTVTPAACVGAVEVAWTDLGGLAEVDDAAGRYSRSGLGGTAQLLITGAPVETAVGALTDAVAACPTATLGTDRGQVVITFGPVGEPALGDAAAVVPVSVSVTREGQPAIAGAALIGLVSDGDRLLGLVTGGVGAQPDRTAFEALLATADQHAAATLD